MAIKSVERFLSFWVSFTLSLSLLHSTSYAYSQRQHHSEKKTGQWRTFTLLLRHFPPFSPHNALSSDIGIPGPALWAVMDGPRRSTVATVIG